jgi:HAD superfamily hydrolase (TIGR01509 family)
METLLNKALMKHLKSCKGIGFDLDGTVVDSKLNFTQMRVDLNFPKDQPILEYLDKISDPIQQKKAAEIIHRHELTGAEQSTLISGVQELLDYFSKRDIPVGLLTRNSQEVALMSLNKFDLDFDIVLSRDNAIAKPDPHGLEIMAKKWGIDTTQMAFFGDSSFDVQTAQNAGSLAILYGDISSLESEIASKDVLSFSCYNELLVSCLNF